MSLTLVRHLAGRSVTCAALLILPAIFSTALGQDTKTAASVEGSQAQTEKVNAGLQSAGSALSQGASILGGSLPGGAVISAAVSSVSSLGGGGGGAASAAYAATGRVMLTPVAGGAPVSCDQAEDGSFAFMGLKPGSYHLRISMNVTVPKQTQGATFGEKVNAGTAKTKHDTAKNSVGNIRARTGGTTSDSSAEKSVNNINSGMPNRISMNVTVARQTLKPSADGESVVVLVGDDGTLEGRASEQPAAAVPDSSDRGKPDKSQPSGPPRPTG